MDKVRRYISLRKNMRNKFFKILSLLIIICRGIIKNYICRNSEIFKDKVKNNNCRKLSQCACEGISTRERAQKRASFTPGP